MKSAKLTACLKSLQQLIRLPLSFANGGFTRPQRTEKSGIVSRYFPLTCPPGILSLQGEGLFPMRGKVGEARMRGYQIGKHYRKPLTWHYVPSSPARGEVNGTREKGALMRGYSSGFTLMEMLVVVLIIGILGAIALPQYQRAVLKSRFAALMPIAKSMADSNEAYYLEHGEYAGNAEDLPVQGRRNYSDGTELEFGTTTSHAYVLATRGNDFPNNYVVYQKHSENYPGEIHCEAATDNTLAQDVCKSFGPTQELGETLTSGYLTYVLFGTGNGVAPTGEEGGDEPGTNTEPDEPETPACPDNATCDDQGNVTCNTGYRLNGNACEAAPMCGGVTQPAAQTVSCGSGYVSGTRTQEAECLGGSWRYRGKWDWSGCTADSNAVQAFLASSACTGIYANSCHDNGDGTISRCHPGESTYDAENHKCMPNGSKNYSVTYEWLYNADGKKVEQHNCYTTSTSGSECDGRETYTYDPDTGNLVSIKTRYCQTDVVMDENFNCAHGGTYSSGGDQSYSPTTGKQIAQYICTYNSDCSTYREMYEYNDTRTQRRTCKTLSTTSRACDEWNAWTSN